MQKTREGKMYWKNVEEEGGKARPESYFQSPSGSLLLQELLQSNGPSSGIGQELKLY